MDVAARPVLRGEGMPVALVVCRRFKVGAQIMMLTNDQGNRWVNGTIGRVVGVAMISSPEEFSLLSAMFEMPGPWDVANMGIGIIIAFLIASGLEYEW